MSSLRDALGQRILVLDGAMGTMIQAAGLTAADFGGPAYEGCNEHLNLTRPDVIRRIHAAYLDAGADIISTNTFGCAPYVLAEYGLGERAYEIARAAAVLARQAAGARFVLGAMGPGTRSISVTRNVTFDEVREAYAVQARGLIDGVVDEGWVNVIGGCCGTTPAHIRALAELVRGRPPRVPAAHEPQAVSGIEVVYPTDDNRPLFVGERTNVIGSRRFKELIVAGEFAEAAEIGRAQVRSSAQVLDICLANPDRDEAADMDRFMAQITRKVKAPLMIDSTDARVIELALRHCQGKAVVNSINLEDGEERFEKVVPLLKTYGGAVIVGCIDEDKRQGMAVTRARKLAIVERSHDLLTKKYGVPARDLIFDALVFPVGTGDVNYVGSAVETIEGIRAIKQRFPECKTILGISNVSFGLPPAGREVLNSVFLYHCTKAGLDYAIVNTERLERYPSIPEAERRLAEDLIFRRGADPVAAFAAYFREKKKAPATAIRALPLDERLARYIVEGSRDGLIADLNEKLKEAAPLDIVNGPLMRGMDEVGRLFGDNQLIVAEVLQSAEAMKAAVAHLEPFMEKAGAATRGTIVLATVT